MANPDIANSTAVKNPAGATSSNADGALCVDLDGTLVRTDTLLELALAFLRKAPWRVVFIPFWILRGKAFFKRKLSQSVLLSFDSLPYHPELLDFLRRESQGRRCLVLASGADQIIAQGVADHLGLFDHVLASDGETNLVGPAKTRAIRALLGTEAFVYAGNSRDDMDVWMNAGGAILVNAPRSCRAQLERRGKNVLQVLPAKRSWTSLLKALRPHQWSKNSLIFVPLILAHKISDVAMVLQAVAGFFAFSFAASALYILNDLLDLPADRNHPRKKRRPFASGALSIPTGFVLMLGLMAASAFLCTQLPLQAVLLLTGYCFSSLAYSLYLKQLLFIDVVSLATFFTVRVVFGGAATGIQISIWTLAFSMFLFLSLALMKRLTELRLALHSDKSALQGRAYTAADLPLISSLSSASGFIAVLVLVLYLETPQVRGLYSHPSVLWLVCPLLIYWLGRFGILANRGYIHDDPLVFAFTDRASLAVGVLTLAVLAFSV
jgi:4-hydroxybenzoate polyprenyltransferase/phosphoserine phosphatase